MCRDDHLNLVGRTSLPLTGHARGAGLGTAVELPICLRGRCQVAYALLTPHHTGQVYFGVYDNCGVLRLTVTVLRPAASRTDRFMLMLLLLLEPPKPTRSAACGRHLLPTHARGCYFARWFYTLLLLEQHTMLSCLLC